MNRIVYFLNHDYEHCNWNITKQSNEENYKYRNKFFCKFPYFFTA